MPEKELLPGSKDVIELDDFHGQLMEEVLGKGPYWVSMRVKDLPSPSVDSQLDQCSICHEDVWISKKKDNDHRILCTSCVEKGMDTAEKNIAERAKWN